MDHYQVRRSYWYTSRSQKGYLSRCSSAGGKYQVLEAKREAWFAYAFSQASVRGTEISSALSPYTLSENESVVKP